MFDTIAVILLTQDLILDKVSFAFTLDHFEDELIS